ncbi:MAG: cell division protein ZapE [Pseudomonadota bacterium]
MTLRHHLDADIQAGRLRPDAAQSCVIDALDAYLMTLKMTPKRTGVIAEITKRIVKNNRFSGVYLHGPVGRGKTILMDAFLTQFPTNARILRTHFHSFMRDTHAFLHARRIARKGQETDNILAEYAESIADKYDVLAFDEFHVTDIADAMILGRLLRGLFTHQVQVILTSNFPPQALYQKGLQRDRFLPTIDLIQAQMQVMILDGPHDYRRDRVTVADIYLTPLSPETTHRMDQIFARLTDQADPQPYDLVMNGRILHLSCTARGVARVSFAAMCEAALGPADYLAITESFDTVMLEDVPHLHADKRNEAKRLMTLVDVLYDRKILLIVSAAAHPDLLYSGTDHGFEFQRTASRLMEMQSPSYLAMMHET